MTRPKIESIYLRTPVRLSQCFGGTGLDRNIESQNQKDARLELEMTRPVTAAASTSLRSFRTYLLVVPAHRAQLRARAGDGGGDGPQIIASSTRGDRP
jgi:hypothetical protein